MRPVLLVLSLLALAAGPTLAQDPTEVDSKHYKVVFENDHLRVIRITYGPMEESVMHYHPAGTAIFLTDMKAQFTMPNGETVEVEAKAGDAIWTEAGSHNPMNLADTPLEVIQVELKTPAGEMPQVR